MKKSNETSHQCLLRTESAVFYPQCYRSGPLLLTSPVDPTYCAVFGYRRKGTSLSCHREVGLRLLYLDM